MVKRSPASSSPLAVYDALQSAPTTKNNNLPFMFIPKLKEFGAFDLSRTECKAEVVITFRVVDAETGAQVTGLSSEAKGELLRKANKYGGTLAGPGNGWINGGGDMTSSAFCKTITGEATSSAVD